MDEAYSTVCTANKYKAKNSVWLMFFVILLCVLRFWCELMMSSETTQTREAEMECDIPSDLPSFACIEYPGSVKNISNALETFGGSDKLQSTFNDYRKFKAQQSESSKQTKEPFVELNLNPNAVFDHPLFGKISGVNNCILVKKTTKIKNKRSSSKIEVLGRITSFVSFDGLADFEVFSECKRPKRASALWSLREHSKYPLVPKAFASKDTAYKHMLERKRKKNANASKQQLLETKPTEIRFIKKEVPKQAKKGSIWRKYEEKLSEYLIDRKIPNDDEQMVGSKISFCEQIRNEIILQIKCHFEVRPIWSQSEILLQKFYIFWYHLRYFSDDDSDSDSDRFYDFDIAAIVFDKKQKNAGKARRNCEKIYFDYREKEKIICKFLGVVGYKFSNGPFRNQFVKFCFDPRAYSNKNVSRPLQIIDYRMRRRDGKKLGLDTIFSSTGSRIEKRGRPNTQKNHLSNSKLSSGAAADSDDNEAFEKAMMDRLQFKSKPNKLQTYYQLKNIKIAEVQQIINNSNPNSYNKECQNPNGWLSKKDENRIRELMRERIAQWIAESVQKNTKSNRQQNTMPLLEIDLDHEHEATLSNENENENDDDDDDIFELF